MPELVSLVFRGFEVNTSSPPEDMVDKFCACIAEAQSECTGVKVEDGTVRDLGLSEVPVEELAYCQRNIHPHRRFRDGSSMSYLVERLKQGKTTPREVPTVRLLKVGQRLVTLDHRRVWCFKEFQRYMHYKVRVPAHIFELSEETVGFLERSLNSDILRELLQKFYKIRAEIS